MGCERAGETSAQVGGNSQPVGVRAWGPVVSLIKEMGFKPKKKPKTGPKGTTGDLSPGRRKVIGKEVAGWRGGGFCRQKNILRTRGTGAIHRGNYKMQKKKRKPKGKP